MLAAIFSTREHMRTYGCWWLLGLFNCLTRSCSIYAMLLLDTFMFHLRYAVA
jgi:hypothetical protein